MSSDRARRAVVFLSTSRSIYRNLALEDWLFRKYDFSDHDGLLIWHNRPAVVVGRHQNVFHECNVNYAKLMQTDVARRQSGGGAVFHPNNNANYSFFTSKERYNRKRNLEVVQKVLIDKFKTRTDISPRHDLLYNGLKISGSASKLSSKQAYHHFTLLFSADPNLMAKHLQSSFAPFETTGKFLYESKATSSIRSKVGWLAKSSPFISSIDVNEEIVKLFSSFYDDEVKPDTLQDSNLTDANFPGILELEKELRSWQWIYGSNPQFSLAKFNPDKQSKCLDLTVEKGLIKSLHKNSSDPYTTDRLIGSKFDLSVWNELFFDRKNSEAKVMRNTR